MKFQNDESEEQKQDDVKRGVWCCREDRKRGAEEEVDEEPKGKKAKKGRR